MVVEIDMGTSPAMAGRPSGRKSLRRRDIQRRDALLQVPNYCWDHHAPNLKAPLWRGSAPAAGRLNHARHAIQSKLHLA